MSDSMSMVGVFAIVAFGGIGLALCFVGFLVSLATAFGNKHWWWAASMLFFAPVAVPYCLANGEVASWPKGLLLKGLAALFFAWAVSMLVLPKDTFFGATGLTSPSSGLPSAAA